MIETSILSDKLRSFEYYEQKLPMYLRSSYGFVEHFRIWYELLAKDGQKVDEETTSATSVVKVFDLFFELVNIFDLNCIVSHDSAFEANEHYLELLNRIEDSEDGTKSDILDKIGSVFGLTRYFSINAQELNLNNRDFLMLIKCTIIKNYFDGSYQQLSDYYTSVGLPIFIYTSNSAPATCILQLINIEASAYEISTDVQTMFLAGMLTVESMGITYSYNILSDNSLAIFSSADLTPNQNGFEYIEGGVTKGGVFVA